MQENLRDYMIRHGNHHGCYSWAGCYPWRREKVKHFMAHLLTGLDFLHARGIIHRELKPQNLLVDAYKVLKIGDLELAPSVTRPLRPVWLHSRACPGCYTHVTLTTVWYRPPEILLGCKLYSLPADVWSCGCVLGEMASGAPLFAEDSEIGTIFKIFQKLGTPGKQQWMCLNQLPDFQHSFPKWHRTPWASWRSGNLSSQLGQVGLDLLDGLLRYDSCDRLSARAALNSEYFLGKSQPCPMEVASKTMTDSSSTCYRCRCVQSMLDLPTSSVSGCGHKDMLYPRHQL